MQGMSEHGHIRHETALHGMWHRARLWGTLTLLLGGIVTATWAAEETEHPLTLALQHATASRDAFSTVTDYTALFYKEEVVGRKFLKQSMDLKIREKPFSVYLKFQRPNKGREVIYVEGANKGNFLVHETGIAAIAGTLALNPEGPEAMKENRYPIHRVGISKMVNAIIAQWENELKFGECDVKYYNDAKLGTIPCMVIESSHPTPRKEFPFQMTRLYIEQKTKYPLRIEQYAFPSRAGEKAPLVELYMYSNLQVNPGLTDRDFDPRNPGYAFP